MTAAIFLIPAFLAAVFGLIKPGGFSGSSSRSPSSRTNRGASSDYSRSGGGEDEDGTSDDSSDAGVSTGAATEACGVSTASSNPEDSSGQRRLRAMICLAIFLALFTLFIVFLIDVIGVPVTKSKLSNASEGALRLNYGAAVSMTSRLLVARLTDSAVADSSGLLSHV